MDWKRIKIVYRRSKTVYYQGQSTNYLVIGAMTCYEFTGHVVKKEATKWEYFLYFFGKFNEILVNRNPNKNLIYIFDNA